MAKSKAAAKKAKTAVVETEVKKGVGLEGNDELSRKKLKKSFGQHITMETAAMRLPKFIPYYKQMKIVEEDEWDVFMQKLLTFPTTALRFSPNRRRSNNVYDTRKGAQPKHQVLLDHFKSVIVPKLAASEVNGKPVEVTPVSWFPDEMAWLINLSHIEMKHHECMNPLLDFMVDGAMAGSSIRQDLHHFLPTMLLEVQPHHKILDLCAFMNYHSIQILEQLYKDPKKLPDGFLIANDRAMRHKHWINLAGTNLVTLSHDAHKLPDLYLSEDHTEDTKVMYDRIMIEAPCVTDGNYRTLNRVIWKARKGFEAHISEKGILKRGLELLAMNGRLIYQTTSLNPLENEAVVAELLRMGEGSLELMDVSNKVNGLTVRPGMDHWTVMCSDETTYCESLDSVPDDFEDEFTDKASLFPPTDDEVKTFHLDRCMRALPHDNDNTAFFLSMFTKKKPLPDSWEITKIDERPLNEQPGTNKYRHPVECMFKVGVTEMEWATEVTNSQLETTTTKKTEKYAAPKLAVARKSLNNLYKDPQLEGKFLTADDPDWLKLKSYYKLSNTLSPRSLFYRTNAKGITSVYYMHPIVRTLKQVNQHAVNSRSIKNTGAKVFYQYEHELTPDMDLVLADLGVMTMLPFLGRRVVNITVEDLTLLLQKKAITFDEFTNPRTRKAVEDLDPGCVVFYYKAEGRQPKPSCDIATVGWRNQTFVKPRIRTWHGSENFHLRLCDADIQERAMGRSWAAKEAGVEVDDAGSDDSDAE